MIRIMYAILTFVALYFFGCCIPEAWISVERRDVMRDIISKSYEGKIALPGGKQVDFLLKLQHDPKKDFRVSQAFQLFKPVFAASQCPFPSLGVKGSFGKGSEFSPGKEFAGDFVFYDDTPRTVLRLWSIPSQSIYFQITFKESIFSGGGYQTKPSFKGEEAGGEIVRLVSIKK